MNREQQSKVLIETIFNCQEKIRLQANHELDEGDNFEKRKRQVYIPVIRGLSGIGKSSFSRKAVNEYFNQNQLRDNPEMESFAEKTFKNPSSYLNIRLDMERQSDYSSPFVFLITVFLYECFKSPEIRVGNLKGIVDEFQGCISVNRVLAMIYEIEGEEEIPILVNMDECGGIADTVLKAIIRLLATSLTSGKKVYITISGLYDDSVFSAIKKSSVEKKDITLPPLTEHHITTMLQLLGITWTPNSNYFRYLIWLTGGIPRYVSYLLFSIAVEFRL
jgi:hypothetical protein